MMIKDTHLCLKIGDRAPTFTLYSDAKKSFALSEATAIGPVLLLFFPAVFTGTCTTELNEVNNDLDSYSGATIVGISTDTPFTLAEYSKANGLKFSLVSDHDAVVCGLYGSKYDHNFTGMKLDRIAKRSAFVIDKTGIVRYAEVLENASQLPDLTAIQSILGSL